MNEDHKKRGLTHSKLLTAVAISSLLLSSGNVMAAQANPDKSLGVTEQLQAITISGLVVDAAGTNTDYLQYPIPLVFPKLFPIAWPEAVFLPES